MRAEMYVLLAAFNIDEVKNDGETKQVEFVRK